MHNLELPKPLPSAVVVTLTLLIWFVIPVPAGVTPHAWHLFALFMGTIVGVISKVMPLGALSMIAIALVGVTGVTNPGKPAAAMVGRPERIRKSPHLVDCRCCYGRHSRP